MSSPVKLPGAGKNSTRPRSIAVVSALRMNLRLALRGSGTESTSVSSPNRTPGPLTLMTATPEGGAPLDRAKIVSTSAKPVTLSGRDRRAYTAHP